MEIVKYIIEQINELLIAIVVLFSVGCLFFITISVSSIANDFTSIRGNLTTLIEYLERLGNRDN